MLLDGVDSLDVARDAIRDSSLWISPNGPLVTGTIEENLWTDGQPDATIDLMGVARRAGVADTLLNLPDGLQTMVSASEERLGSETRFRLGIARGFVKKPCIVVAEEPVSRGDSETEQETTQALQDLARDGAIVLVLARRVSTLRAADHVLVLHENHIADQGTHVELLEQSELYRHLNYVRFAVVTA
jgi:ABC-type multidrug transport system fused ATPase/permease subunit